MEKQNPTGLPPAQEGSGPGAASPVPEPWGDGKSLSWLEKARMIGWAQMEGPEWEEFLAKMWTPGKLDEDALFREVKVLLRDYAEKTLSVLPPHMRAWLEERKMLNSPEALQLAEAYTFRMKQPWARKNQGAAGSSSSTVQPNPPDVQQEEDGKTSILAGHKPESVQPGTSSESARGQEGNATEDKVDPSMSGLGGAVQEQERQMGDSGLVGHRSLTVEEELTDPSLLQKTFSQISISGAPSAEEKL